MSRLESETADLEATTTAALAAIEAKRQRAGCAQVHQEHPRRRQAAASARIDLGGLGALVLGGGGALAWQARRGRKARGRLLGRSNPAAEDNAKARDKAYDEGRPICSSSLTTLPRSS